MNRMAFVENIQRAPTIIKTLVVVGTWLLSFSLQFVVLKPFLLSQMQSMGGISSVAGPPPPMQNSTGVATLYIVVMILVSVLISSIVGRSVFRGK